MQRLTALTPAFFALFVGACADNPYEDGLELAEEHVELVRADQLTFERFSTDLEAALADFDTPKDKKQFRAGYDAGVEPVKAEITAMVVAQSLKEGGAAVEALMESVGRGMGRMAGGFLDGLREVGEAAAKDEADRTLKDLGRDLGRTMKKVEAGLEEVHDGIQEGLEEADAR